MGWAIVGYFFSGMFITLFSIALLLRIAPKLGLVDHPDSRKFHVDSTPVIGGIAMFMAIGFSVIFFQEFTPDFSRAITLALFLVALGVLDDRFPIRASVRFSIQIVLTLVLIDWTGYQLSDMGAIFGGEVVTLEVLAIPMTLIGVVGMINAVNLSDGVDGLAGSLVLVAMIYLSVLAWSSGNILLLNEFSVIIGALFVFLLFNWRYLGRLRAKIFMGDAGSMLLGFLLAWYFISLSQGELRLISPVTALWLFAMPLFDTVGVMLRRTLHGRSPFSPDREHMHHILLHAGFSTRKAVSLIVVISIVLGGIGVLGQITKVPEVLMFSGFLGLFTLYFFAMMHAWKLMKILRKL